MVGPGRGIDRQGQGRIHPLGDRAGHRIGEAAGRGHAVLLAVGFHQPVRAGRDIGEYKGPVGRGQHGQPAAVRQILEHYRDAGDTGIAGGQGCAPVPVKDDAA